MSFLKQVQEWLDHLRGKGPAAAVALTLDLGEARENKPYYLEAGGLIVEKCEGDLEARINGPNGDGINLRHTPRISYPLTSLYITNPTQAGRTARILLLPAGLEAEAPATQRLGFSPKTAKIDHEASGDNQIVAAVTGRRIKVYAVVLVVSGAVNAKWRSGSTDLTGDMNFGGKGEGYAMAVQPPAFVMATNASEALILNLSAAVAVDGIVAYWDDDAS